MLMSRTGSIKVSRGNVENIYNRFLHKQFFYSDMKSWVFNYLGPEDMYVTGYMMGSLLPTNWCLPEVVHLLLIVLTCLICVVSVYFTV